MTCPVITGRNRSMNNRRSTDEADISFFCCLIILLLACDFTPYGFGIFGRVNTKGAPTTKTGRRLKRGRWLILLTC